MVDCMEYRSPGPSLKDGPLLYSNQSEKEGQILKDGLVIPHAEGLSVLQKKWASEPSRPELSSEKKVSFIIRYLMRYSSSSSRLIEVKRSAQEKMKILP